MLSPSPSLSLLTSMVVSLPGLTSHVAGSAGGSSGLTEEPERSELLEREEAGPPCCLSTAFPGCWLWWWCCCPLAGPPASWVGPAAFEALLLNPAADGNKEEVEEVEVGDREGTGSTGVASDDDTDADVETRMSAPKTTASSDDVDEMEVDGTADRLTLATFSGDCGADWLNMVVETSNPPAAADKLVEGREVEDAPLEFKRRPLDRPDTDAGFGAICGFGGTSRCVNVTTDTHTKKINNLYFFKKQNALAWCLLYF